MHQRLSTQLRNYGCELDPRVFKQVLAEAKQQLFPGMSEERLACAEGESIAYCDEVRARLGVALPRPFIKFQLLNNHK